MKGKRNLLQSAVKDERIIAALTLIKRLPEPLRWFIGNLAHVERILAGLDIQPKK
jgi:hypothetical protein